MRGILILHIDVKDCDGGQDEGYEGRPQESQFLRFKHPPPPQKKFCKGFPLFLRVGEGSRPTQKRSGAGRGGESEYRSAEVEVVWWRWDAEARETGGSSPHILTMGSGSSENRAQPHAAMERATLLVRDDDDG